MENPYRHQCVRDLAWALGSPPLMVCRSADAVWPDADHYERIGRRAGDWLSALDDDPARLQQYLAAQKDRRLGHYFESLWAYWLKHGSGYEIVGQNVQIVIDGRTLGEMDFILFDPHRRCFMHWELAIKFFLGVGDTRHAGNWHGPGQRDRLDRKLGHLRHTQSVISRRPPVADWLRQQGIDIATARVILKGRLYYPPEVAGQRGPAGCAVRHERGHWLEYRSWREVDDGQTGYEVLRGRGWLASVSTRAECKKMYKPQLIERIESGEYRLPLHVSACNKLFGKEYLFIVADDWTPGDT